MALEKGAQVRAARFRSAFDASFPPSDARGGQTCGTTCGSEQPGNYSLQVATWLHTQRPFFKLVLLENCRRLRFIYDPFAIARGSVTTQCPNFVTQTVSLRFLSTIQRARKLTACVTKTELGHYP